MSASSPRTTPAKRVASLGFLLTTVGALSLAGVGPASAGGASITTDGFTISKSAPNGAPLAGAKFAFTLPGCSEAFGLGQTGFSTSSLAAALADANSKVTPVTGASIITPSPATKNALAAYQAAYQAYVKAFGPQQIDLTNPDTLTGATDPAYTAASAAAQAKIATARAAFKRAVAAVPTAEATPSSPTPAELSAVDDAEYKAQLPIRATLALVVGDDAHAGSAVEDFNGAVSAADTALATVTNRVASERSAAYQKAEDDLAAAQKTAIDTSVLGIDAANAIYDAAFSKDQAAIAAAPQTMADAVAAAQAKLDAAPQPPSADDQAAYDKAVATAQAVQDKTIAAAYADEAAIQDTRNNIFATLAAAHRATNVKNQAAFDAAREAAGTLNEGDVTTATATHDAAVAKATTTKTDAVAAAQTAYDAANVSITAAHDADMSALVAKAKAKHAAAVATATAAVKAAQSGVDVAEAAQSKLDASASGINTTTPEGAAVNAALNRYRTAAAADRNTACDVASSTPHTIVTGENGSATGYFAIGAQMANGGGVGGATVHVTEVRAPSGYKIARPFDLTWNDSAHKWAVVDPAGHGDVTLSGSTFSAGSENVAAVGTTIGVVDQPTTNTVKTPPATPVKAIPAIPAPPVTPVQTPPMTIAPVKAIPAIPAPPVTPVVTPPTQLVSDPAPVKAAPIPTHISAGMADVPAGGAGAGIGIAALLAGFGATLHIRRRSAGTQ